MKFRGISHYCDVSKERLHICVFKILLMIVIVMWLAFSFICHFFFLLLLKHKVDVGVRYMTIRNI